MGKDGGFLTPKAIANRIKAKGLQKLRWYCQMCQKQCRDENGFKCHTMSESHQRQLLIFAENSHQFMNTFSQEFKDGYLTLLKQRFGTKRVHANQVYQEYIADRQHVHMNSTEWETLTDFVKWLGREGLCTVDDTEKGWFVQYIDRDPETIQRQEAIKAKEKLALDDEERSAKFIQEQVKRASQKDGGCSSTATYTELQRVDDEEKVTFRLPVVPKADTDASTSALRVENPLEAAAKGKAGSMDREKKPSSSSGKELSKRKSALDEIIEAEERRKVKIQRTDYWLAVGIVVKVITKKLGEKYYKQKGVVLEIIDKYGAIVKMTESGEKVKLDQTHLETVIPAVGKRVMILNGVYRGYSAVMHGLNEAAFSCSVKIASGPYHGKTVEIAYEDLSKLHQDES